MEDQGQLEGLIQFHGHMCAGLALGVRASQVALRRLGTNPGGNDLIVSAETDTCSVDAIQVLTGCTFGNGKLYFRDHAKSAYTFWQEGRERALRIVARPEPESSDSEAFWRTFEKVQRGSATDEERAMFFDEQRVRSQRILAAPDDALFVIEEIEQMQPARPLVTAPVVCTECGEATMAHRTTERAGAVVCVTCGLRSATRIGAR